MPWSISWIYILSIMLWLSRYLSVAALSCRLPITQLSYYRPGGSKSGIQGPDQFCTHRAQKTTWYSKCVPFPAALRQRILSQQLDNQGHQTTISKGWNHLPWCIPELTLFNGNLYVTFVKFHNEPAGKPGFKKVKWLHDPPMISPCKIRI